MRKTNDRGFTILEMVIVLAVIGVLAGVLIPTFSGVVNRTKLNRDTQSVSSMNLVLETDEILHGPAEDIETVMSILAKAGFTESSFAVESDGYAVYWYKPENRLILYNDEKEKIAYPDELDVEAIAADSEQLFVYNQNEIQAIERNIVFSSKGGALPTLQNAEDYSDFESMLNADSVRFAMNQDSVRVVTAARLSENGAVFESASLESDSQIGNAYRISLEEDLTGEQLEKAQIAAGEMLYTLFAKINAGQISGPVAILLGEDAVLDVSSHEWIPVKAFCGYFGCVSAEHKATILGAKITENTALSDTLHFEDGKRSYAFTGFFGSVYGKTTIENVIFDGKADKDGKIAPTIHLPASDAVLTRGTDSANCVGIIGSITDGNGGVPADVMLRGITVTENISIVGVSTVGGLVGYIGASDPSRNLEGEIYFSNCGVAANALSTYSAAYDEENSAPVGGFIGMTERMGGAQIVFQGENIFSGTLNGHYTIGAVIGRFSSGNLALIGEISLENAKLNTNYYTRPVRVNPSLPEAGEGTTVTDYTHGD